MWDGVARSPPRQVLQTVGTSVKRLQYYHIKLEVFYRGEVKVAENFTICNEKVGEVGKYLMEKVNVYFRMRKLELTFERPDLY